MYMRKFIHPLPFCVGLSLLAALLLGFTLIPHLLHSHEPIGAPVVMDVLDPSLEQFAPMWQEEIGRRFPRAVGVLCHGGEFIDGQWIVAANHFNKYVTAQELVRYEQAHYPDRTVVLLACNPGHLHLNIPGVFHADSSVWCVPDRFVDRVLDVDALVKTLDMDTPHRVGRSEEAPDVVGNIYEFVEN